MHQPRFYPLYHIQTTQVPPGVILSAAQGVSPDTSECWPQAKENKRNCAKSTRLTPAGSSHAHVVRGNNFLLDGEVVGLEVVCLQGVPENDRRVIVLILEGQEFLRADGVQRLVGLSDEAWL